jgi:hypothetical protein
MPMIDATGKETHITSKTTSPEPSAPTKNADEDRENSRGKKRNKKIQRMEEKYKRKEKIERNKKDVLSVYSVYIAAM